MPTIIHTPWGPVGYLTYKRTYARRLKEGVINSKTEEYYQTVDRVINGAIKQLKVPFTNKEQETFKKYMLELKGTVAGRFFWQLGTKTVDQLGLPSLQNCAFTVVDHPITPFTWTFDMLMLGSGVGYNIQREFVYKLPKVLKKKVKISRLDENDADYVVPDKREGWVKLLGKVLKAYFYGGEGFTYSTTCIRGKGTPIKGFGGTASGPEDLVKGINNICGVLDSRRGKQLRPIDCLDIMNIIGSIVVAGNVRRSAQIAIGDYDDLEFLEAKTWSKGNIPNWRAMSNNSVVCNDFDKLPPQFWEGYMGNGEAYGLINLKLAQSCGRVGETQYAEPNILGFNPCVTGDTEVLTDMGYKRIDSLLDDPVNVWNGFEFSEVQPRITGRDQQVLEVSFSNGRTLKCTPQHNFVLAVGYTGKEKRVEAKNLVIGDKLIKHNYPVIKEGESYNLKEMYTQGFYSGDGVKNRDVIWLYEPKFDLEEHLDVRQIGTMYTNRVGVKRKGFKTNFKSNTKEYVPFEGNLNSRLNWLAGIMDSDGVELKEGGCQIASIDRQFLLDIQKLLTICGTESKINLMKEEAYKELPDQKGGTKKYHCKDCFRICIGAASIQKLKDLGLPTKRLMFDKTPNRDASRFVQVTGVSELGVEPIVYCFTEPKRNLGCFNGIVTGQCAEQGLESFETCCLAEIHLPNITSEEEFKDVATYLYRVCKHSLAIKCHQKMTEEVVHRNMKMGIGITGDAMATKKQLKWLDSTYEYLREYDKIYSKKHGFPESVKLTTVKPSGTLSLLSGVTPGAHVGYSHFYIRRIRMASGIPLVDVCKQNGYKVEFVRNYDGTDDHSTVVVEFPCKLPKNAKVTKDVTAIDQLETVKRLQTNWSDNAVSVTIYYKKEELDGIKQWLSKNYNNNLKTVSFLLHSDHGFDQAPYEEITEEEYKKMSKGVTPITNVEIDENTVDELGACEGGVCPIK